MAESFVELAKRDREAAVRRLMEAWNIGRAQAELDVAIELGEFQGDVFTVDEKGRSVPLKLEPSEWLRRDENQAS